MYPFSQIRGELAHFRTVCVPEFFIEVEGVVHAELWQRPAEICLMFFPWRAVTSVGSFTGLECPRPSWDTHKRQHSASDVLWKQTLKFHVYNFLIEHLHYLSLAVTAPGIDISGGGQREDMFTAQSNVFYEQPLQGRHQLRVGFILQHRIWQANQSLWMNRREPWTNKLNKFQTV